MPNAIVLTDPARPGQARRAAGWITATLTAAGFADRAGRIAASIEEGWDELVATVYPRAGHDQMLLLALNDRAGRMSLELVAERQGRVRADFAARAARFGLIAEKTAAVEGLARLRLAL
ncbi:hypothetical protein LNKW23_04560 [Paralimibaculum aggregatum]|uniref:Uncharacterized protein n=1 Tax=Paralimibaculum aggregatum TaxID=3036245 RepID=A0ABQ6LD00_9RHOB|nr:hypothetical protein [Limibaculum sp. NKW23]GMG81244.1 hypothetical protein LNKW23_04560 [Limibaculum sp. NKW23]